MKIYIYTFFRFFGVAFLCHRFDFLNFLLVKGLLSYDGLRSLLFSLKRLYININPSYCVTKAISTLVVKFRRDYFKLPLIYHGVTCISKHENATGRVSQRGAQTLELKVRQTEMKWPNILLLVVKLWFFFTINGEYAI